MKPEPQILRPWPGVVCWNVFSPEHRVDLTCTAVSTGSETLLFDPFPAALDHFKPGATGYPTALCLTSGNHARIDVLRVQQAGIPLLVPRGSGVSESLGTQFDADRFPVPGWQAFPLAGGGPGETAYFHADHSLMVFGDAIIHLPGRGLELLPAKYCSNLGALRDAVLRLTAVVPFENAVFAHGSPLVGNAGRLICEMVGRTQPT